MYIYDYICVRFQLFFSKFNSTCFILYLQLVVFLNNKYDNLNITWKSKIFNIQHKNK
jgi:hypothetical protein